MSDFGKVQRAATAAEVDKDRQAVQRSFRDPIPFTQADADLQAVPDSDDEHWLFDGHVEGFGDVRDASDDDELLFDTETGKNKLGFYASIDEYWKHNKEDKYNYGNKMLPKFWFAKKSSLSVRRGAFIHAYVGMNGGGKTLAMLNDTLPTMNGQQFTCKNRAHGHPQYPYKGYRKILSSVRLIDPRTGGDHPLWVPLKDHRQLLFVFHADILFDEVTGLASQDENFSIPVQIKNMFAQLRRRDCIMRWTTPNWTTAAKSIRNVTRAVTYCRGMLPVFTAESSWPSNTWFSWKTYDAGNFENFQVGTMDRLTSATFQYYFRPRKRNMADQAYDTLAEVLTAGATNDAGLCVHCGGKRTVKNCTCPDRALLDAPENLDRLGRELMATAVGAAAGASAQPGGEHGARNAPTLESAEDTPVTEDDHPRFCRCDVCVNSELDDIWEKVRNRERNVETVVPIPDAVVVRKAPAFLRR